MTHLNFEDRIDWEGRRRHAGDICDGLAVLATVIVSAVGSIFIGLVALNAGSTPELCREFPTECVAAVEEVSR